MNSQAPSEALSQVAQPPKLLDLVAITMERQRYALASVPIYQDWIRRFILFHQLRHPRDMSALEVGAFLDHLALIEKRSLQDQAAARNALLFLYQYVVRQPLGEIPVARVRAIPDRAERAFGHMPSCPEATPTQKPKLLDQVREMMRGQQYALNTEECYVDWIRRFILHHNKRHPKDMGKVEVETFLTHLAAERDVSISTQRQAMNALLFLYQRVLKIELGWLDAVRAKRVPRLPVVMSRAGNIALLRSSFRATHAAATLAGITSSRGALGGRSRPPSEKRG